MLQGDGARSHAWVGGSDAHTERRIAAAYTAAPGLTKDEFLDAIRRGLCAVGGDAQGLRALVRDVHQIVRAYYGSLYGRNGRSPAPRRPGNVIGSIALLPAVAAGLPAILTTLQMARQEWIARCGAWTPAGTPLPARPREPQPLTPLAPDS
jgi:hypothetical protein